MKITSVALMPRTQEPRHAPGYVLSVHVEGLGYVPVDLPLYGLSCGDQAALASFIYEALRDKAELDKKSGL